MERRSVITKFLGNFMRMRSIFSSCLLCGCFLISVINTQNAWAEPSKDQMRAMIPKLNEQILKNPNDAKSLALRGFINKGLGDFQSCISDCSLAIAANPSFVEAYNYRFIAYMQLKNYQLALLDANEVVRLQGIAASYCNRGSVYLALRDYNKAISDFSKGMQLDNKFALAYNGLGESAYRLGKYEKAVAYCNRALSLNHRLSEALYFRGKSYEALGKKSLAQKDLADAQSAGYRPGDILIEKIK